MTSAPLFPLDVKKEFRALAPVWAACVGAIGVAWMARTSWLHNLVFPIYLIGTAALGGWSIGHEYSAGTLTALLAQPVGRRRLFAAKAAALVTMTVTLLAVAVAAMDARARPRSFETFVTLGAPFLFALSLGPAFTMSTRSPMAGAVFSIGLPGVLFTFGELIYVRWFSPRTTETVDATVAAVVAALTVAGAVVTWRSFMRLEAGDHAVDVPLPAWLRRVEPAAGGAARGARRSQPLAALARKEMRLQQMPLMLACLYIGGAVSFRAWSTGAQADASIFEILTTVYAAFSAILAGAVASEEERQIGTLEWQLLQPVPAAAQWAVKAATAIAVGLVLALGVPSLAAWRLSPPHQIGLGWLHVVGVVGLTTVGLYASSLTVGGVRALIAAVFGIVVAVALFGRAAEWTSVPMYHWMSNRFRDAGRPTFALGGLDRASVISFVLYVAAAIGIAILLRIGLANHRSADRSAPRIWTQTIALAVCATAAGMLMATLQFVVAFAR